MEKEKIFLPLTIDKRFWNKSLPNVFLNKVYERQLDESDADLHYETLITSHPRNDKRCKPFIGAVTNLLGNLLNKYHGLNESCEFWNKMLFFWVQEYVCSIRFKIDQLNHLRKEYPPELYSYYTFASSSWRNFDLLALEDSHNGIFFEETYHFISYLWLAERYFDVHLDELDIEVQETKRKAVKEKSLLTNVKQNLKNKLVKLFPSRMKVGVCEAQEGRYSWLKWYWWSKGAIRRVLIPEVECTSTTDTDFRNQLKGMLMEEMDVTEEEEMILDFLPQVFPRFFVEDFKVQYVAASEYLREHPNLSIIYTSTGMVRKSVQKMCMLLLQKRGGKVLGQQHGSAYNVTQLVINFLHELELNDVFYYWGSAIPRNVSNIEKASYAPAWKLEADNIATGLSSVSELVLYVTTEMESYPRSFHYGYVDKEFEEYLAFELQFLGALKKEVLAQICLRPYHRDFGWHMSKQLSDTFPEMKADSQTDFEKLLKQCSLFIVDHISTTWLEALYINKPMIVFTTQHSSVTDHEFWDTEKPYFNMLEEAGIVFYSPEKAAAQVNRIMDEGIMTWWMDQKRQQVLQTLRERWTTKVENIDKWWYHEMMSQVRTVE